MNIAIVTGASSGLGMQFVRTIAERETGLDEIWVIARRKERLEQLAAEVADVTVRPLSMDLSDRTSFKMLKGLLREEQPTIRLLVNNAGYCGCGRFDTMGEDAVSAMLNLNIAALTWMNRVCFPYMESGSCVILTSSVSSFVPVYGQAVYSASKAYVRYLGHALYSEMKKRQVYVLTLCPGNMDTEMNVRGGGDKERREGSPILMFAMWQNSHLHGFMPERVSIRRGCFTRAIVLSAR